MHIRVALISLALLLSQSPSPAPRDSQPLFQTPALIHPLQAFDYKPIAPLEPLEVTYPVAAAAAYSNPYEWGNCTWYVAGRIHVPDTWGNANTWAYGAAAAGYTVSPTPVVGAIAQTSAGYYGHVAIVSAIDNGSVRIDEMNVLGLGVADSRWVPISSFVYIYI